MFKSSLQEIKVQGAIYKYMHLVHDAIFDSRFWQAANSGILWNSCVRLIFLRFLLFYIFIFGWKTFHVTAKITPNDQIYLNRK